MRPLILRGQVWGVIRVSPDDPFLIDNTGTPRIATTDPITKTIRISTAVPISMFDKIYLHEATHAMIDSTVINISPMSNELMAWFLENHSIEIIKAVSESLGRPICIDNNCIGGDEYEDGGLRAR